MSVGQGRAMQWYEAAREGGEAFFRRRLRSDPLRAVKRPRQAAAPAHGGRAARTVVRGRAVDARVNIVPRLPRPAGVGRVACRRGCGAAERAAGGTQGAGWIYRRGQSIARRHPAAGGSHRRGSKGFKPGVLERAEGSRGRGRAARFSARAPSTLRNGPARPAAPDRAPAPCAHPRWRAGGGRARGGRRGRRCRILGGPPCRTWGRGRAGRA
jgi:hypothetical protein